MSNAAPLVEIRGIAKSYGAPVLEDVRLDLHAGEVHALVGENGAGKSTLSRILAGLTAPDRGELRLDGRPFAPRTKAEAQRAGVHMVMQELNLIATLSVAENIFLDRLPHRGGWIDFDRLYRDAGEILARIGLGDLDPRLAVESLGVGHQQMIEIAASLWRRCRLLILDEPTAALTESEVKLLFAQVDRLRAEGVAILYISHRLEEIRQIANRLSVLRDGRLVGTRTAPEFDLKEVVRLMVGRDVGQVSSEVDRQRGTVALSVRGLRGGERLNEATFEARHGEILGFAGLMGSGRTECLRAIFGADRRTGGEVFVGSDSRPVLIQSPRDAVSHGLAFLTEDRKSQGLFLSLSIRENLTVNVLGRFARMGGWLRRAAETAEVGRWIQKLGIRCRSADQRVAELSGGNQQKVILARWLCRDCDILMVDEPTRGVDVGARFEIHRLLVDLAQQGKAVLVVSSDMNELLGLCDRIAVMSAGRLVAIFKRGEWTQQEIMTAALSAHLRPSTSLACGEG